MISFWRKEERPAAPARQNSNTSENLRTVPFCTLTDLIHLDLESTEHSDDDWGWNDDFESYNLKSSGPKGAIPCEISIATSSSSLNLLEDDEDDDLDATEALVYQELRPWCKVWADEFLLALENKEYRFANVILQDHPILAQVRFPFGPKHIYPLAYLSTVIDDADGLELLSTAYEAYPEAIGYAGCLPLHYAARHNAYAVEFLLERFPEGAKCTNDDYQTALHIASQYQIDCMPLLAKTYPTAVQLADADGFTPAHYVVQQAKCSVEILRDVLGPAALRCTTRDWQRPLHLAAANPDISIEVIRYILATDPKSIEATTDNFESVLHCAANTDVERIQLLLDAFPQAAYYTNNDDETPYDVALRKGASSEILDLLSVSSDSYISL